MASRLADEGKGVPWSKAVKSWNLEWAVVNRVGDNWEAGSREVKRWNHESYVSLVECGVFRELGGGIDWTINEGVMLFFCLSFWQEEVCCDGSHEVQLVKFIGLYHGQTDVKGSREVKRLNHESCVSRLTIEFVLVIFFIKKSVNRLHV